LLKKPPKLQLQLTLEFSLFFIVVAVLIYIHFTGKFEDDALEKFRYKAQIVANYLTQNPEYFNSSMTLGESRINDLMKWNDAAYVVLEDNSGNIVDAVNIEQAEDHLYITTKNEEGISLDKTIYKVAFPVISKGVNLGRVYVGFISTDVARELNNKFLLTALFSLIVLLAGIVFTYFLSSISFRPITRLISLLDRPVTERTHLNIKNFKNDEIGILARKIDLILTDLDRSSGEVDQLNKQFGNALREKINELDMEISQRKKAEVYLRKSEEQFKSLFDNAPIGMVIFSERGIITKANSAFCKTVDYTEDEILGLSILRLFEASYENFGSSEKILKEIKSIHKECVLVKNGGTKIDCIIKSITICDDAGNPVHSTMQVLDISEMKKTQNDLELALDKARESDRLKSAFLAQMSHEIRTPLNVILVSIPLIADEIGNKDRELQDILYSVGSAGKRLHRTIDMILSMSAIQSGNYKPEYEKITLGNEIKSLSEEFRSLAEEKSLKLFFENHSTRSNVFADKYTVTQIFQNLLGNAIKYTQSGQIQVTINDYNSDKVVVKVEDTGIGMSEAYLTKIFSPFSQEDIGQKRKYEGNGLGLALVKKYVEINRAEIKVSSEKNKGSVFSVIFNKSLDLRSFEDSARILDEIAYAKRLS
jgi:PAS domain S-box-containing protein